MNRILNRKELMSAISIIPESAPFSSEQRAWLNGFFAGITGIADGAEDPSGVPEIKPEAQDESPEEFPWHDDSLSIDERMELAKEATIDRQMMAAMAQLDCGSCGYLCQTYSEAIANGEESNLTLCTPGGKETAKELKRLVKLTKNELPKTKTDSNSKPTETGYSRKNPFSAKLIRSDRLNGLDSNKDVRHVEIDLQGSGIEYKVGDALGIYPTNCHDLVNELLDHCHCNGDRESIFEALMTRDLANVTDELFSQIRSQAEADDDLARIRHMSEDEDQLDELDVLDMLQLFDSISLPGNQLLKCLPSLQPRLYSIASSIKRHPGQVHLTVGRVEYTKRDRRRKGVASTLLADRVEPGAVLKVFLQQSHGFRLPSDDKSPIIMIGPGTGIAPFIAFLQEREQRKAAGRNWLFFGDQKSATDFLYKDQLMGYLEQGVLDRLDTAFSRDQEHKVYVQDRMLENAAELFDWIQSGASLFVCGDASRMAKDVDRALHEILQVQGNQSPTEASDYVKKMKKEGRYLRDVY